MGHRNEESTLDGIPQSQRVAVLPLLAESSSKLFERKRPISGIDIVTSENRFFQVVQRIFVTVRAVKLVRREKEVVHDVCERRRVVAGRKDCIATSKNFELVQNALNIGVSQMCSQCICPVTLVSNPVMSRHKFAVLTRERQ